MGNGCIFVNKRGYLLPSRNASDSRSPFGCQMLEEQNNGRHDTISSIALEPKSFLKAVLEVRLRCHLCLIETLEPPATICEKEI